MTRRLNLTLLAAAFAAACGSAPITANTHCDPKSSNFESCRRTVCNLRGWDCGVTDDGLECGGCLQGSLCSAEGMRRICREISGSGGGDGSAGGGSASSGGGSASSGGGSSSSGGGSGSSGGGSASSGGGSASSGGGSASSGGGSSSSGGGSASSGGGSSSSGGGSSSSGGGSASSGGGFAPIPPGVWAVSAGGTSTDIGLGVTVTSAQRAVVTGTFRTAATFGLLTPTEKTITAPNNGYGHLFVAQYELDAGFVDVRAYPDQLYGSVPAGVTALPNGDVALYTNFSSSISFAPDASFDAGSGAREVLVRLRPDFSVAWARAAGTRGYSVDQLTSPAVLPGGLCIAGDYAGDMHVGYGLPNETQLDAGGAPRTPFFARFEDDGALSWARSTISKSSAATYGLASAADGGFFVGGVYSGSHQFVTSTGGIKTISSNAIAYAGFVARLDEQGYVRWAQTLDPVGGASFWHFASGANDGLVATGYFHSNTTIGDGRPGTKTFPTPANGSEDGLLARYEDDGRVGFAVSIAGANDEFVQAVSSGPTGEIAVAVTSNSSGVTFNAAIGDAGVFGHAGAASVNCFVAVYSPQGVFKWGRRIYGAQNCTIKSVQMLSDGTVLATGAFAGTATFVLDATTTKTLSSTSGNNSTEEIYLARFGP
ncbi:MAG: hypothetical protein K1X89_15040 [Myxococcaceae bacterium]|nr:hypothetical protein [Myxococcaceae bacterium]